MKKRIVSIVLILCMFLSLLPVATTAASASPAEPSYLTFFAEEAGSTVKLTQEGKPDSISVQYSTDSGATWTDYTIDTKITLANVGDKVQFKGNNTNFSKGNKEYYSFVMSGKIAATGDVTSLLNGVGGDVKMPSNCFQKLFKGCESLTAAPALPSTSLSFSCYNSMFSGCASLSTAPELPATEIEDNCYNSMFSGCTSLITAPSLPATTLKTACYSNMFYGCTSLTTAPTLSATKLANTCYDQMFSCCTSLTTVPSLPVATTLDIACYQGMFAGCSKLAVTKLENSNGATVSLCNSSKLNVYFLMFVNTAKINGVNDTPAPAIGTTEYYKLSAAPECLTFTAEEEDSIITLSRVGSPDAINVQYRTCSGTAWTAWTDYNMNVPNDELLEIMLTKVGDKVQFKAKTTNSTFSKDNRNYYYFLMTGKIAATGDVTSLLNGVGGDTQLSKYCFQFLFTGCSALTKAPNLPSLELSKNCYAYMFRYCSSLEIAPILPATKIANNCYQGMFKGCSALTTAPELPAVILCHQCYDSMFMDCTSLATVPSLPKASWMDYCYQKMFSGCSKLVVTQLSSEEGSTISLSKNRYQDTFKDMFAGTAKNSDVLDTPAPATGKTEYYQLSSPIAVIESGSTTYYPTLQQAINSKGIEDEFNPVSVTIKLLADITENIKISQYQTITIDMNDKVLSGTGTGRVIESKGSLTILDNSQTRTIRYYSDLDNDGCYETNLLSPNAILVNGAVITGGLANITYNSGDVGGAIYCDRGSLLSLSNVSFVGNKATKGGALKIGSSNAIIDSCVFAGNTAVRGGAISTFGSSNTKLTNCRIFQNSAIANAKTNQAWGGGITSRGENAIVALVDTQITNNIVKGYGENLAFGGGFGHNNNKANKIIICGKTVIDKNYVNGIEDNYSGSPVALGEGQNALKAGAKIGYSFDKNGFATKVITTNGSQADLQYFFSDSATKRVVFVPAITGESPVAAHLEIKDVVITKVNKSADKTIALDFPNMTSEEAIAHAKALVDRSKLSDTMVIVYNSSYDYIYATKTTDWTASMSPYNLAMILHPTTSENMNVFGSRQTITLSSSENGTVSVGDYTNLFAGETVTISVTPEDGYELDEISVFKTGDKKTVVAVSNNTTFTMPDYPVTVEASYTFVYPIQFAEYKEKLTKNLEALGKDYRSVLGNACEQLENMSYDDQKSFEDNKAAAKAIFDNAKKAHAALKAQACPVCTEIHTNVLEKALCRVFYGTHLVRIVSKIVRAIF